MSTINDEEILITFEELRQLDKADISICVDKYSALSICEKSCAPPGEIYNVWVQKLFKAYELQEFSSKDWQNIIEHLGSVLREFVKHLRAANDTTYNQLDLWWSDTQELLKWLETVFNSLDMRIMSLLLTFVLEIIIKTCKFADKRNIKSLMNIQQLVISLTNSYLLKMPVTDATELETFNKVISSLCDVGALISSADIKTTIETWRVVVKLSEKYNNCCKTVPIVKIENCKKLENNWHEKAIRGIFKELQQILQLYNRNPISSNDNLLQIGQFYLKLLRLLINNSKVKMNRFPAAKEFIEVYTLCHHDMSIKDKPKLDSLINKGIFDIFYLIHQEKVMPEMLMQHLKCDVEHFKSCDLVLDYLKVITENCCKNRLNVKPNVEMLLKLYNCLFEGPLIFVDSDKYSKILEYFVVLTALDNSKELHRKLCEYVVDSHWIRAYASTEILNIYYSYIFNQLKNDAQLKCLEFWFNMWNKLNKSTETFIQHKKLIEILIKTILQNITEAKLQISMFANKFENMEIILLKCGKETEQLLQYLQTNLLKYLNKIQERHVNGYNYRELLNLLDICVSKPQLISNYLKETLLNTFVGLFSLAATELQKFREFINKCLRIFLLTQDKQLNEKLLTHLSNHEHQCCTVQSVFLIEFLLKQKPQSTKLLQNMKTSHKLTTSLSNLLQYAPLNSEPIQLRVFKNLPKFYQQSSNPLQSHTQLEHIKKKPRLDDVEGNFSNIKFILNDLSSNSQKLLNFERSSFDAKDIELMLAIKSNIDKCLTH